MEKIDRKYNPKDFEENLYNEWEQKGYFKPTMDKTQKAYSIVMPPPNVTGKLHMGHALDGTIQDVLIRTKRMQGYNTLWLPGTDHASIATEAKVVEKMKKEGLTKQGIGREKFLERAWEWTKEYGGTIQKQQRKIGSSCDWSRSRFTLDEGLSKAVVQEFVNLYNDGKIYKGKKMINWCPTCHTTISNAEVEYTEKPSHLWHLRYKIVKNADETDIPDYVEVATTRPETMLGDTAVAVNPQDTRYTKIVGRKCILPIVNREIPIIADDFVDIEFGTGCVKVTPAHDPNDYQAGIRHNLPIIDVFDENSVMLDLFPKVKGMKSIDAREVVVDELKKLGALVSIEDYMHNVGTCYRCHGVVEPRISEQWFVAMKELAKPAIEAVKNGDIKFVPKKYEKTYFNWLENIQDWCISRQLWWGHRIPAYYCKDCGNMMVASEMPKKCTKCGKENIYQDEDTLDTWFSSALWPFSTMGWPDENAEDYKTFFPTDALVTGYDIIFFWVVRMVFSSYYATKEKPFSDIIIHGLVRDSQGRKMSKSLGNGIDPLEIVDKYGADALRFSLLSGTTMGNDIKYMTEKLDQASNFANKIWNAYKFVANSSENVKIDYSKYYKNEDDAKNVEIDWNKVLKDRALSVEEKWIISKLNKLIEDVTENINKYDLGIAVDNLYSFIWNEFCDWFIEMEKTRIYSGNEEEQETSIIVLEYSMRTLMKLLHPFMPFVTSEIYGFMKSEKEKDLMVSSWPTKIDMDFSKEEEFVEKLKNITIKVRNIRLNMNVHPSKKVKLIFVTKNYGEFLQNAKEIIKKLDFGSDVQIVKKQEKSKLEAAKDEANSEKALQKEENKEISNNSIAISENDLSLSMDFNELVDVEEEKKRLQEEKKKLEAEVKRSEGILSNKGFLAKAPEAKVNEEKQKYEKYKAELQEVEKRLNEM